MPKGKVAADPLNRRWRPTPRALVLTDERVLDLSAKARLVLMLLFAACDDAGRFSAHARGLGQRIGWDGRDLRRLLLELQRAGLVDLYEVDGRRFGAIVDYEAHVQVRMSWGYHPTYPARPPELSDIDGWPPAAMRGGAQGSETGNGSPSTSAGLEGASQRGEGAPPHPSPQARTADRIQGGEGDPLPPSPPPPLSRGQREKREEVREKRVESSSSKANVQTRERPGRPLPPPSAPAAAPASAHAIAPEVMPRVAPLQGPPTADLSPATVDAIAMWQARLAIESPSTLIADAQVERLATQHGEDTLVEGIDRHLAEAQGSKFWARFPLKGLTKRVEWAAADQAQKHAKEAAQRERRRAAQGQTSSAPAEVVMAQVRSEKSAAEDHRSAQARAEESGVWREALGRLANAVDRTELRATECRQWFLPIGLDHDGAHVALVAPDMAHAMVLDDSWRSVLLDALGDGWERVTCRAAGSSEVLWEAVR